MRCDGHDGRRAPPSPLLRTATSDKPINVGDSGDLRDRGHPSDLRQLR